MRRLTASAFLTRLIHSCEKSDSSRQPTGGNGGTFLAEAAQRIPASSKSPADCRYVRAILESNQEWINDYNPLGGEAKFTLAHQAAYYGAPRYADPRVRTNRHTITRASRTSVLEMHDSRDGLRASRRHMPQSIQRIQR